MSRLVPIVLVTLAALSLSFIFDHELWTPDEPRDAEIAREAGFSPIPTLNQEPFLEKPPLYYWMAAASYRVFGASAWSARIPSILLGWGTLLFSFLLARRMFGRQAGLYAVLILGTTLSFLNISHKCTVDNALLFFTTGLVYWLHEGFRAERKLGRYLVAYGFALGAVMSKGLIGLVLTAPAFFVFLLWTRSYREILRAQPWFALLIVGAGLGLWLAALPPELRDVFLLDNHLGRFTGAHYEGGHMRPAFYYLSATLAAFLPWTLALVPALVWGFQPGEATEKRFLLCWLLVGILLLSLASTKRGLYLLPLLPAGAILIGGWFERVARPPRWAAALLVLLAAVILLAQLVVWVLGVAVANWLGLGISLALAGGAWLLARGRETPVRLALGTASVALGAVYVAVPTIETAKNLRPFCEQLPALSRIAALDPDETTQALIPFYTGMWVESATDAPYLVVKMKPSQEPVPSGYTTLVRFDPPPLELFGRKIRLTDRGMRLLAREGAGSD